MTEAKPPYEDGPAGPGGPARPGVPVHPGVPAPPPLSLRQRKKAAAMRHVQDTALELFLAHGFDQVTIEQIATAAETSPSTVYRYFGTKEGLVLHDEHDDRVIDGIVHYLRQGLSPWDAVMAAFGTVEEEHFVVQEGPTRERIRLFFEVPSVRSAAYLVIDELTDQIAHAMAETGHWSFAEGRVIASAMVWPFVAALKNWHESTDRPFGEHVAEAIAALRSSVPS